MSILSTRCDEYGYYYGFVPGDVRRVDVRFETFEDDGDKLEGWVAYVDGVALQHPYPSLAAAESAAAERHFGAKRAKPSQCPLAAGRSSNGRWTAQSWSGAEMTHSPDSGR